MNKTFLDSPLKVLEMMRGEEIGIRILLMIERCWFMKLWTFGFSLTYMNFQIDSQTMEPIHDQTIFAIYQ